MTPREKAYNLICKFYFALPNNGLSDSGINSTSERWKEAEKCALIAVDEIRDNLPLISEIQQHWIEVKNEIITYG
jgi:hypothetical protein